MIGISHYFVTISIIFTYRYFVLSNYRYLIYLLDEREPICLCQTVL